MKYLLQARLILFLLGLVVFFVAHRYLKFESYYLYLLGAGGLLLVMSSILPIVESIRTKRQSLDGEAKSWRFVFIWMIAFCLGIGLYLLFSKMMGASATPDTFGEKALLAGWLLILILSGSAGIGIELSHRSSGTGKLAEPSRVGRAGLSWLLAGMVLSFLVCFNYLAAKKDKAWDWSYLKTSTPGEATVNMFLAMSEPINVAIFYENDSDVRPFVSEYFEFLKGKTKNFNLHYFDVQMHPTQAEKYKASKNGQVILERKDKRERINVGKKLRSARSTLKKFDAEVQKAFLRLTEEKKRLYFSRGHGEMSWLSGQKEPLRSIKLLEKFLRSQNFTLRLFGVGDGSTKEVPADAGALVIVGPTSPFLSEEVEVLRTYVQGGGRLLAFLDVAKPGPGVPQIIGNADDPLLAFLKEAGLTFNSKLLANDKEYVSATRSPVDRWFLFSNSFSSHESVTGLARNEERIAVMAYQMGYFDVEAKKDKWKAYTTVRSRPDTFVDLNKNFTFDKGTEKRKSFGLGVAAVFAPEEPEGREGRIVAFSDANLISDVLIRNRANALYVADSVRWLVGKPEFSGETSTEEDIKIRHTNKEDAIWFNVTVIVMPLFVLLIGFIATRRKKKVHKP